MTDSSRSRSRRTIENFLLFVLSLTLVAAVLEGLLVFVVPPPIHWRDPQELYLPDPKLGHRLMPRQESYTHSFPVVTNSFGLRNREFSALPGAGIVRILCVGDSLTFGDGVADEDTYPRQLEEILAGNGKEHYEVINAGVPSYDTWQELTYLEEYSVKLKPAIVTIGFYANDVVPRPSLVATGLTSGGTLRRQGIAGRVPDSIVHFLKSSRLFLIARDRIGKLSNLLNPSPEARHQQSLLEGVKDDFIERGWQEVEVSLKKMVLLGKDHGFKVLLVIFPMPEQLMREYPRAQYQTRLRELARKHGIPYINLFDSFKKEFNGFESLFIEWDGHPNPKAHQIAAEEIARSILLMQD